MDLSEETAPEKRRLCAWLPGLPRQVQALWRCLAPVTLKNSGSVSAL